MIDKATIIQVLGSLIKEPSLLSKTDIYNLTIEDFTSHFEKYIFSAIYNLYQGGARNISIVDIDNYFNSHPVAKQTFEQNKGIEYLQDALDFSDQDNFPFYYKRLKKFNALIDLNKMGFDTSQVYQTDPLAKDAKEINEKFEKLDILDIFNLVKRDFLQIENKYSLGDASATLEATNNIENLLEELKLSPDVGAALQGDIFNTVCRGARKSKFYIRSASSGVGKSRSLVGDACHTAYPMRFNHDTWQWEWNGSSERTMFIATEQEIGEIQTLILAYLTGFNEEKILYSYYNDKEKIVLEQALKVMKYFEGNFFIVRLPNPSIEQIKAIVRQNWIVYDIQNIFYDYIFSSPSLLNEFRDLRIREDVALMLLSTALKDLAVELGVFIMSATQTNAKQDDARGVKTESVIRGSRAIIDKADIGCVISRINPEELELLTGVIDKYHETPNQVTDIYKVRRGRFTNVKIWSYMDLGTCRKKDLFITGGDFNEVEGFKIIRFKEKEPKTYTISEVINSEFGKKGEKKIIKLKGLEDEERASRETFGDLD